VKNAPLILIATSFPEFTHNNKPNRWKEYDTGAASENICLQAVSMGLAAHQMGGFSATKAREVFQIPEEVSCMAFIAVGYQSSPDKLEGDLRDREIADRRRNDIGKNFYNGKWGNGYR
jgi:nitroreductase